MGLRVVTGRYGTDFQPSVLDSPAKVIVRGWDGEANQAAQVFLGSWLRVEVDGLYSAPFRIHLGGGVFWTPQPGAISPEQGRICYC